MANQIDLVSVVTNKLENFRQKDQQVAVAVKLREEARVQLADAQNDLNEYIKTVSNLATEITSELSSTSLAEVKAASVADSLKAVEPTVDETLKEVEEPAKTAVSDESSVSEVEVTATDSKGDPARKLDEKLSPVEEDEEPEIKVTPSKGGSGKATVSNVLPVEVKEEITEEPVVEKPKAEKPAPKIAEPAKKAPVSLGGLWDDDDDEDSVF